MSQQHTLKKIFFHSLYMNAREASQHRLVWIQLMAEIYIVECGYINYEDNVYECANLYTTNT